MLNEILKKSEHIIFAIVGTALVAGGIIFFVFYEGDVGMLFSSRSVGLNASPTSTQGGTDALSQNTRPSNKRLPERKWEVLDPTTEAKGILIQALDEDFPFLRYRTRETWPAASLTKLLTAVVVLEQWGEHAKVTITENAMRTQGIAGGLKSGEVYLSGDLLKIMLLTSSNRAASAFEDFAGGRAEMNRFLNKKAGELGMRGTILNDASGLNDANLTSAEDMFILTKYIYERHPEILNWTRLVNYLVQPTNTVEFRTEMNINPFVMDKLFLGGKTGTSEAAQQNLVAVFSFKDFRIAVVILGSPDRVKEVSSLLSWMEGAYQF